MANFLSMLRNPLGDMLAPDPNDEVKITDYRPEAKEKNNFTGNYSTQNIQKIITEARKANINPLIPLGIAMVESNMGKTRNDYGNNEISTSFPTHPSHKEYMELKTELNIEDKKVNDILENLWTKDNRKAVIYEKLYFNPHELDLIPGGLDKYSQEHNIQVLQYWDYISKYEREFPNEKSFLKELYDKGQSRIPKRIQERNLANQIIKDNSVNGRPNYEEGLVNKIKEKIDYAKRLGKVTPEEVIQAYNGYGYNKEYKVDMGRNPVYGKKVLSMIETLKKNKELMNMIGNANLSVILNPELRYFLK